MSAPFKPPAKPLEPLDSWAVNKFKARLGEIAGCAGCLSVFGVVVVFMLIGLSIPIEEPVTAEDRALMFDVRRIADWSDAPINPDWEYVYKEASSRVTELYYTYDPTDEGPFVASVLWLGFDRAESIGKYAEYRRFLDDEDLIYHPISGLCSWGQESECGLVSYEGESVGNFFIGYRGKVVTFIQILRIYSDSPEDLLEVFPPYLATLENHAN